MSKLIHITDLYHPHADPDDHFDSAQVFSLAKRGDIDLCRVIIDFPDHDFHGDPALWAIAQLNMLSGKDVPVTVGADVRRFRGRPDLWKSADKSDVKAAEQIIKILRDSDEPVYITIVGGCLDTAIAIARDPDAFEEKCAGIVLNAGTGTNTPTLEWNVNLGHTEYAAIFDAPCPVFWDPCFDNIETGEGVYKTHWKFRMGDVFGKISNGLRAYFIYMLTKSADAKYLRYLEQPADAEALASFGDMTRDMWCTGPIFDLAGLAVGRDGSVLEKGAVSDPVFVYEPISVKCGPGGVTEWSRRDFPNPEKPRYIYRISDPENYDAAMTKALAQIYTQL